MVQRPPVTAERWLPVPIAGFEKSHEVSDLGRVRSLERIISVSAKWGGVTSRRVPARVMTTTPVRGDYLTVTLGNERKRLQAYVHQLVLLAFIGPRPEGCDACHGPGGRQDNRLLNLCWGTKSKNHGEDRLRDGTLLQGSRNHKSKLTEATVIECRMRHSAGEASVRFLAEEFGVSDVAMSYAIRGKTWRHVDGVPN